MNVEKLDNDLYYYTDILTEEEQKIVIDTIKNDEGWTRVYDYGDVYDPNRDPDADSSQSCMPFTKYPTDHPSIHLNTLRKRL